MYPGARYAAEKELRTVARRDKHDLYKARTAIQFLTLDAPWLCDAPRRVV